MDDALQAALLDGVPLPMILIGRDARILRTNAPARALLGADPAGRHYMNALRQPELVERVEQVLAGGGPGSVRHVVTGPGRDTVYRVLAAPLAGQGASLAFEDITEIEQASEIRRDFVANVSHELRTPLTALLGFIETLRGPARDDAAARERFLGIMAREAGRMNRLVADLLSLSRVEAEERVRPMGRVDLVALTRATVATLRPLATAAGVGIEVEAPEGKLEVRADADQLTQVLNNLIENAVKYGHSGGKVEISLAGINIPALGGRAVSLKVKDHGEGIDELHLARLTERFYRVDAHRSREQGGTGLGLAIVKHIVQRHRGRLRVESRKGEGCTFTVLLPGG
ncbi:MAG: ATP-binding protein [Gemmobacter sp.]